MASTSNAPAAASRNASPGRMDCRRICSSAHTVTARLQGSLRKSAWGRLSESADTLTYCLPVLEALDQCQALSQHLERMGQYLRPCGGGGLYLLSHRTAAGIREEALISAAEASAHHVITAEREARSRLDGEERERLVDRILRTHAILQVARRITEDELPAMLSDLRLGAAMGVLEDVKVESVTATLIEAQPAGLASLEDGTPSSDWDALRARCVRERIVT